MTSPNFPYNSYVLQCLQTGLVDNAPTPWPPMNSDEEIGYNAISAKVNQTGEGGIRSAYTNLDNSFSDWRQDIHDMKMPAGIQNADNWTSIQHQIRTELEYVTTINKLFANINTLTQDLGIDNADILKSVGEYVGLIVDDNKETTVNLILSGMFFGILGAIDNVLPPPANWIVTLISAGLSHRFVCFGKLRTTQPTWLFPSGCIRQDFRYLVRFVQQRQYRQRKIPNRYPARLGDAGIRRQRSPAPMGMGPEYDTRPHFAIQAHVQIVLLPSPHSCPLENGIYLLGLRVAQAPSNSHQLMRP